MTDRETLAGGGIQRQWTVAPIQGPIETPYDITPRVWRDEQPGDEPRLVVSVAFVPRSAAERWQDVQLQTVEVRVGDQRWTPSESGEKQLEWPADILRVG